VLSQMGASVVSFPVFGRVIHDGVRPPLGSVVEAQSFHSAKGLCAWCVVFRPRVWVRSLLLKPARGA
jgi:hypothetical protein